VKRIKRNILLNPGPATTTDDVKNALVVDDICPREKEFGKLLDSIRRDIVKVVNGGDEYISVLFSGSGTAGDEAAICSAVPRGKKILVVDNGAYGTRMVNIAEVYGIDVVKYKITYGDYPDLREIEKLFKSNSDVSHLAVVHHETTTGMLNPIKEISDLSHRYGAQIIVDAMSSYAGVPIDIKDWNIDYLISSSNKCIQGMAGITFVICRKNLLKDIKHNRRSYYLDLCSQHEYFEKYMQMQFTPPVQIAYALRQALDEYFEETVEGRASRYRENWETMYSGLKELGFKFLLSREHESGLLIAIIEPADSNYDFNRMHDYLFDRGYTIYPGKGAKEATFRLAVIGDIYKKDIENFLIELKNYLVDAGIREI